MSLIRKLMGVLGLGTSGAEAPGSREISCHEALALVNEFLDGELVDVTTAEVKAHFDVCQRCYPHLRLEGAFRDAMHRVNRRGFAPAELRDRVKALLADADR